MKKKRNELILEFRPDADELNVKKIAEEMRNTAAGNSRFSENERLHYSIEVSRYVVGCILCHLNDLEKSKHTELIREANKVIGIEHAKKDEQELLNSFFKQTCWEDIFLGRGGDAEERIEIVADDSGIPKLRLINFLVYATRVTDYFYRFLRIADRLRETRKPPKKPAGPLRNSTHKLRKFMDKYKLAHGHFPDFIVLWEQGESVHGYLDSQRKSCRKTWRRYQDGTS